MSLFKNYNLEKYSIIDLKNFVEKNGYQTKKVLFRNLLIEKVEGVEVYLEYPTVNQNTVSAAFRFRNNKEEDNYQEGKKLYNSLQRSFPFDEKDLQKRKFSGNIKDLKEKLKDWDKIEVIGWYRKRPHFLHPHHEPYILNIEEGKKVPFKEIYNIENIDVQYIDLANRKI